MNVGWGQPLSEPGQMTLNVRYISGPKACSEYVILHELCIWCIKITPLDSGSIGQPVMPNGR